MNIEGELKEGRAKEVRENGESGSGRQQLEGIGDNVSVATRRRKPEFLFLYKGFAFCFTCLVTLFGKASTLPTYVSIFKVRN